MSDPFMIDVYRKELKYYLHREEMNTLKQRLSYIMSSDGHNGPEGYRVRSLYFDTVSDGDYQDKMDGLEERRKIRLRIYDAKSDTIKLELKEKTDQSQRKRSLSLNRWEAEEMIAGRYAFLLDRPEALAGWLYAYMNIRCYRPKCVVEYDRYAFGMDTNDIRVTFDHHLRAGESSFAFFDSELPLYPVMGQEAITMEVKYNGFLFSLIKQELNLADRMVCSRSKYCSARMITKKG